MTLDSEQEENINCPHQTLYIQVRRIYILNWFSPVCETLLWLLFSGAMSREEGLIYGLEFQCRCLAGLLT